VFKYLLLSIVIVPVLLGVKAAEYRSQARGFRVLMIGWAVYGVTWLGMLYYLRDRWVG
jgi:hypothetical protein